MARYKLLATETDEPTGELEEISPKQLVKMAAQRIVNLLIDNKTAIKGSVKVKEFNRKFQLTWKSAKDGLYHQASYVAFITKKGAIRAKGTGSKVTVEAPTE